MRPVLLTATLAALTHGASAEVPEVEPTLAKMVASLEAGRHTGSFYDGEGLFGRGQTGMQQLGICILDKVGVIIHIFNWGEGIPRFLDDLLADTAACCTTSAQLQGEEEEDDTGFCCFGRSCCDGNSESRARPGDWCDGSRTQCMSCAGQPTWCEVGKGPRKSAKEWCLGRLKLGYSILHKLAQGNLGNASVESNVSADGNNSGTNQSAGSNQSTQRGHAAAGSRSAPDGDAAERRIGTTSNASSDSDQVNATNGTNAANHSSLCHDAIEGEQCYKWITWAHKHGMREHPEWYAPWGLNYQSTLKAIQANLWLRGEGNCTLPCGSRTNITVNDLIGAYAGHLLAAARELLGNSAPINNEAKGLLARCAAFPRMPCKNELGIPRAMMI